MMKRYVWVGLGLLGLLGLGCLSRSHHGNQDSEFWSKPSPIPLYRGLTSGLTPAQAWQQICRRWSFGGQCSELEPLGPKTYFRLVGKGRAPLDLKLYRYTERDGAFPCQYYLFFRNWGLSQLRWQCQPQQKAQISARIRQFRRLYGKPLRLVTQRSGRVKATVWEDQAPQRQVILMLVRNQIMVGIHRDLRLEWTHYVERLRPELSEHATHHWRLWNAMPLAVRRELLEHFSRMLVRLKRLLAKKAAADLPTTDWGPVSATPGCRPVAVEQWRHAFGRSPTWRNLKFLPQRPMHLQYQWQTIGESIYSRSFVLKARGCGYRFSLVVEQHGRKITIQQLRLSPIGKATKDRKINQGNTTRGTSNKIHFGRR